jgi:hypothetical protein
MSHECIDCKCKASADEQTATKLARQITEMHRKDRALGAAKQQNTQIRRELEEARRNNKELQVGHYTEMQELHRKHRIARETWKTERESYLDKINQAERQQGLAQNNMDKWKRFYTVAMEANELNKKLLELLSRRSLIRTVSHVIAGLMELKNVQPSDQYEIEKTIQEIRDVLENASKSKGGNTRG